MKKKEKKRYLGTPFPSSVLWQQHNKKQKPWQNLVFLGLSNICNGKVVAAQLETTIRDTHFVLDLVCIET